MGVVQVYKKGPDLTRDLFHDAKNTVSKFEKPVPNKTTFTYPKLTQIPGVHKSKNIHGFISDSGREMNNLQRLVDRRGPDNAPQKGTKVHKSLNEHLERLENSKLRKEASALLTKWFPRGPDNAPQNGTNGHKAIREYFERKQMESKMRQERTGQFGQRYPRGPPIVSNPKTLNM